MQRMILFDPDDLETLVERRVRAVLATVAGAPRYKKWWMARFLQLLVECEGNVTEAVDVLREEDPYAPSRATIYRAKDTDSAFRRGWEAAVHPFLGR